MVEAEIIVMEMGHEAEIMDKSDVDLMELAEYVMKNLSEFL